MTENPSVEERLSRSFGAPMSTAERAWVDDRVSRALATAPARSRRTRLLPSFALAAALMVIAPTVFVVGAAILSSEAPRGMGNAATYEAEIKAAKAVTPIPAGATWPPSVAGAPDRSASYGTGLGTQVVQSAAYCLWLGDWYAADKAGNAAEVAVAAASLDAARDWKAFTDPLTTDQGFREAHTRTIDAALAGDAATVAKELELNCGGIVAPTE